MWVPKLVNELLSIAQAGLTYCPGHYCQERYNRLQELTALIASKFSAKEQEEITELFGQEIGYHTPKVDVRGAVFQDNKILMVKESDDGTWSLPGGWADVNLSPSENVLKEIAEESGFICSVTKLIAVYDKNKYGSHLEWPHIYKLFFLCEITGGCATLSHETTEIGFFASDQLPPLSPGRVTAQQIERCFAHYQNLHLPSDFD